MRSRCSSGMGIGLPALSVIERAVSLPHGNHRRRRSLARQCGRRDDRCGVREGGYGRGRGAGGGVGVDWMDETVREDSSESKRVLDVLSEQNFSDEVILFLGGSSPSVKRFLSDVLSGVEGGARKDCGGRGCFKLLIRVGRVDGIDNEVDEGSGDGNARKEEMYRGVLSTRGAIRWVVGTWDIGCAKRSDVIGLNEETVNAFEDGVGFGIPVPTGPPSLHNTGVVSEGNDPGYFWVYNVDCADEQFKTDCFRPANVSLRPSGVFPARDESPGTPVLADDNANAHARAGI